MADPKRKMNMRYDHYAAHADTDGPFWNMLVGERLRQDHYASGAHLPPRFCPPPLTILDHKERQDSVIQFTEPAKPPPPTLHEGPPTYSARALSYLRSRGNAIRTDETTGFHLVRTYFLHPPCIRSVVQNPKKPFSSETTMIPMNRASIETLRYLSFSPEHAEQVWQMWETANSTLMPLWPKTDDATEAHKKPPIPGVPPRQMTFFDFVMDWLHASYKAFEAREHALGHRGRRVFRDWLITSGFDGAYMQWCAQGLKVEKVPVGQEWKWLRWQIRGKYWLLETAERYAQMHFEEQEGLKGRRWEDLAVDTADSSI